MTVWKIRVKGYPEDNYKRQTISFIGTKENAKNYAELLGFEVLWIKEWIVERIPRSQLRDRWV